MRICGTEYIIINIPMIYYIIGIINRNSIADGRRRPADGRRRPAGGQARFLLYAVGRPTIYSKLPGIYIYIYIYREYIYICVYIYREYK